MPLHAIEDLEDALDATRAFLWPIDRSTWIKLAVVMFFVGGPGVNLNVFQYNVPAEQSPPGTFLMGPDIGVNVLLLVAVVIAAALSIGLLVLLVGSIMEFVLVESLRREEVLIRQYWAARWRQGARLFGFRFLIGLLVFGSAAVVAVLFLLPVVVDTTVGAAPDPGSGGSFIIGVLLLLPAVFVLAVVVGLVHGFTTVFVVPIMVLEDCGVLDGWRRLWPTITANPWQYLTYAVVSLILNLLTGVFIAVVVAVAVLILLIPLGVLGALGYLLSTVIQPLGIGLLVVVALLFGVSTLVVIALAQVPVVAYLRYYALLVLGDIETDLDLIPERRAAVRTNEE